MRHVRQSWRSPGRMRPSVGRCVWLWSGLVLFTYVATHLANHVLGLISLEAMETGRAWFLLEPMTQEEREEEERRKAREREMIFQAASRSKAGVEASAPIVREQSSRV